MLYWQKSIFPGWICRFYHDSTVPKKVIDKLKEHKNVELVFIEKTIWFQKMERTRTIWNVMEILCV